MNLLLDTNVYAAFFRGRPEAVKLVSEASMISLSVFVIGELIDGFRRGSRARENWGDLQAFLAAPRVRLLPATIITADRYSRVLTGLRTKGKPIPTNDVWIAAHALEVGADLASYDEHFGHVDGLAWVNPASFAVGSSRRRDSKEGDESGHDAREQERKHFLELADRLARAKDPSEQARLKQELARLTFGE